MRPAPPQVRAALRTSNDGAIGIEQALEHRSQHAGGDPRGVFAWRFRVRHGHVDAASGKLISQRRAYRARAATTTAASRALHLRRGRAACSQPAHRGRARLIAAGLVQLLAWLYVLATGILVEG